jgi:hypothetical protein
VWDWSLKGVSSHLIAKVGVGVKVLKGGKGVKVLEVKIFIIKKKKKKKKNKSLNTKSTALSQICYTSLALEGASRG